MKNLQISPKIIVRPNVATKLKFKFVFDDASVSVIDATNFQDAAILSIAARIRGGKSKKLIGSWTRDDEGNWQHVVQDVVLKF